MGKLLLLAIGILLIIGASIYIAYSTGKKRGNPQLAINKKGLFAAIGAILLGIILVYRNTKKS